MARFRPKSLLVALIESMGRIIREWIPFILWFYDHQTTIWEGRINLSECVFEALFNDLSPKITYSHPLKCFEWTRRTTRSTDDRPTKHHTHETHACAFVNPSCSYSRFRENLLYFTKEPSIHVHEPQTQIMDGGTNDEMRLRA
jgi:hypothetical protein